MIRSCQHCSAPLDGGALLCNACGAVDRTGPEIIECGNHWTESAVAVCVVCGKAVCGDCAVVSDGVFFCEDSSHRAVYGEWIVITRTESPFEADMILRNLEQGGFQARGFEAEHSVAAMLLRHPSFASVWVPRESAKRAIAFLRSLRLLTMPGD